jgi:hypothetical protein
MCPPRRSLRPARRPDPPTWRRPSESWGGRAHWRWRPVVRILHLRYAPKILIGGTSV